MKKALILSILTILFISSCSSSKDEEPVHCTEEYVSITVKLVDKDDTPFALSNYKVFIEDEDITSKVNYSSGIVGFYPIAYDSMQPELEGKEAVFTFIGYVSGEEVIRKDITIGANKCHIYCVENLTFTIE